ncbi:MAG: carboxylesterase family protein [Planctomycetaceae bacterium]|nr:carboxylesterase family protein [Planctomycetaceae bacterium]
MPRVRAAEVAPVQIDSGLVRGTLSERFDEVIVFRGIPYADTTAGANRWRPPQPVKPWDGICDCQQFGPACPQAPYPKDSVYYREPEAQSEDCLSLNVWTAGLTGDKRPVMVWIHGGALTRGSGSVGVYDGASLARKGVVIVTINYRLGPLGFFAHPELTSESAEHAAGNYGLLDQIAALRWVQRNIAQFGGDPGCVTIFGESAGSLSVNALVASPLAQGLFHRAIGQSGTAFRNLPTLAEAESAGAEFATKVDASDLATLRQLSAEELLARAARQGEIRGNLNCDGWSLPEDVKATFLAGRQHRVPTIAGSNADEMTTLAPLATRPRDRRGFEAQVALTLGNVDEVQRLYPVASDGDAPRAYLDLLGDVSFTLPARSWARWATASGSRVYLYQFTRVAPFAAVAKIGAYHAAEIAYVFDNLDMLPRKFTDADRKLAETMSAYWVAFAKMGDPNVAGLPSWPAYNPADEPYLAFGDSATLEHHLRQEKLDLIERLLVERARLAGPRN